MNVTTAPSRPFSTLQAASLLLVALLVGLSLASTAALALDAPGQLVTAGATAAVCFVATVVSLEPVRLASHASLERVPVACLAGMAVRLILTLSGAMVLVKAVGLPQRDVGLWVVGWYLLLVAGEVCLLVRYFAQMRAAGATPGPEVSAC